MDDVSLHSPVAMSTWPQPPSERGQLTYTDDEDDEPGAPDRIWPMPSRYGVRSLRFPEYPAVTSMPRPKMISRNALVLLTVVGLVIFACSTASLVLVAMLMDSTRSQINSASIRLDGLEDYLSTDRAELAQLTLLMQQWLGNVTWPGAAQGNSMQSRY